MLDLLTILFFYVKLTPSENQNRTAPHRVPLNRGSLIQLSHRPTSEIGRSSPGLQPAFAGNQTC